MLKTTHLWLTSICLVFFFLFPTQVKSQSKGEADSLKAIIETSTGSGKVRALIHLSNIQVKASPSEAIQTAQKAQQLSREIHEKELEAEAKASEAYAYTNIGKYPEAINAIDGAFKLIEGSKNIGLIGNIHQTAGICYERKGDLAKSLYHAKESLKAFEKQAIPGKISYALNNIANIYYENEDYTTALEYYFEAQEIKLSVGDPFGIGSGYANLAVTYKKLGEFEKALNYYHKAVPIQQEINDRFGLSITFSNIGTTHSEVEAFDSSIYYHQLALEISEEIKDTVGIAIAYHNMGNTYTVEGDFDQAVTNYKVAAPLFKKSGIKPYILASLRGQSELYRKFGFQNKAEELATSAMPIAEELNSNTGISSLAKTLYEINKSKGNFAKALSYHEMHKQYADSLISEQKVAEIGKLEINHEINLRNQEIKVLAQEGEIQNLKLEKAQTTRTLLIILVIVMLIGSITIWNNYRLKKKSAEVLDEKNKELEKLNQSKDRFFAIISHDLKNPLSAFRMMCEAVHDNIELISKDEIKEYMQELMKSSDQLHSLLKNLLSWVMIRSDRIPYNPKPINIEEVVNQNLLLFEQVKNLKGIQVKAEIDKDLNFFCDSNAINLIIRNLLSNAIKFSNQAGQIVISAKGNGEHIDLSFKDFGLGMSATDANKLFKIDQDPTEIGDSKEKGTGLGLLLTHEFVRKNKGEISVKSKLGEGSTFTVSLPKVA